MAVVALVLLSVVCVVPAAHATDLPTGAWTGIANAFIGTFQINGVDGSGNLSATFLGDPVTGFWNSTTNQITFLRQDVASFETVQYYVGHLMFLPDVPGQSLYVLTGHFTAFSGTGGDASRPHYAWIALITAASPAPDQ
jgi:hypothetical protein